VYKKDWLKENEGMISGRRVIDLLPYKVYIYYKTLLLSADVQRIRADAFRLLRHVSVIFCNALFFSCWLQSLSSEAPMFWPRVGRSFWQKVTAHTWQLRHCIYSLKRHRQWVT